MYEKSYKIRKYDQKVGSYSITMKNATSVVPLVSWTPNQINKKYFFSVLKNQKPVRAYVETGCQLYFVWKGNTESRKFKIELLPGSM